MIRFVFHQCSLPVLLLLSSLLAGVCGFLVVPPRGAGGTATTTSLLLATTTKEDGSRIKSVGGGIAVVPSGQKRLFDPTQQGKLGGTDDCDIRVSKGASYQYLSPTSAVTVGTPGGSATSDSLSPSSLEVQHEEQDAQHWLEDIGIPTNFAKPTKPVDATVLGRVKLISDNAPGDIEHIVMRLPDGMHYVEGQSLSVIPPGADPKTGKHQKPRLYSIASTRYGDLLDGNTVSLCVRRAEYFDPNTGQVDPSKKGVCSNYLCDINAGDIVKVAGPIGKTLLLPEDSTRDIIMVATGTGIAPFRGFLHRLFMENTVARHVYTGNAWLILGVPVSDGLLYHEELEAMKMNAATSTLNNLEVTYAISREMKNRSGGKYYVQDVLTERADELYSKMENGAVLYFCGLKGMMPGILDAMEQVAKQRQIDWTTQLNEWKKNGQWHVEVY